MCRIAVIPNPRGQPELAEMLEALQASNGGDGNGVALIPEMRVIKGVELSTANIAKIVADRSDPVIFHTRRASVGAVCNHLCQPFKAGDIVLAHNGTSTGWREIALALFESGERITPPLSDSLTMAHAVRRWGRSALWLAGGGTWVVGTKDKIILVSHDGNFEIADDHSLFASELSVPAMTLSRDAVVELWPKFNLEMGLLSTKAKKYKKEKYAFFGGKQSLQDLSLLPGHYLPHAEGNGGGDVREFVKTPEGWVRRDLLEAMRGTEGVKSNKPQKEKGHLEHLGGKRWKWTKM